MTKSKEIHKEQIKLRNIFFKKIDNFKKKNIDISKSIFTFGCTWQPNASFFHLKYLAKPNLSRFFKMVYYLFLDILFVATLKNFKIRLTKYNNNYDNLILTWGGEKDFDKNGNYFDKKFSSSNTSNKTLWYVLGHENLSKVKKAKNTTIHYNEKISYNFLFLLKKIIQVFYKNSFSIKKTIHYANFYSLFAENLAEEIYVSIKKCKIKNIDIPYEGQPFQDYLIKFLKKKSPKIKITGYAHSSQPLPLHLIYKDNKIDKLIAHNHNQYFHLNKRLFWPKKKLLLEKSKKIRKLDKNKYLNKVIIPYGFESKENIIETLQHLILKKKLNLKSFEIQNHPLMRHSKKHMELIKSLNQIKKLNFDIKKFTKNKSTIIIGPTSAVPEALQTVNDVYHIYEDGITQTYSSYFWPNIKVETVDNSVIKYYTNDKSKLFIK
jgi:hypothetical protein